MTYVGSSTIHVRCDIYQKYEEDFTHVADAIFIMAARNGKTKKAYHCPKIDFSKEEEPLKAEARSFLGQELRNWIKEHDNLGYRRSPTSEEAELLHSIFQKVENDPLAESYIPMSATEFSSSIIVHLQQKNAHGNMFGGYLM